MKKGKFILGAVALLAVVGGALAFKATRATDKLYYISQNGLCRSVGFLTPTTTTLSVPLPPGAIAGWYTNNVCTSTTVRATTSPQ
jgi:hypothetical protein